MGKRKASVANLPAGVYYASVYGPGTGTNNYKLIINVTGP